MFQNRKIILCGLLAAILASCSPLKYIPVQEKIIYTYKDTTIVHRDTISIEIPREVVKEVVYADSSHLETSVARSNAWVDSLSILHHTLENKAENALKKEVVFLDKIVYRDSTIVKEVPYEVQVEKKVVPKWCWYLLGFNIILLIVFIIKLYLKLK